MTLLRPFMPYIIGAGLMAVVAACGAAWLGWKRAAHWQAQSAAYERRVTALELEAEQAREARRVADAWRAGEARRAARLDASIEALLTGDFADADLVLDPRITSYLECLRTGDTQLCAAGADRVAPAVPD